YAAETVPGLDKRNMPLIPNARGQPRPSSHWVAWLLCSSALAVAAAIDVATGPHLIVDPFYFIPVALAGWFRTRGIVLVFPFASALVAEAVHRRSDAFVESLDQFAWNFMMRLMVGVG